VASENYSLALSLLDFVPNLAFLAGAVLLVLWARRTNGQLGAILMVAGSALVFVGGTTKAIWKLIVTIGGGDIVWLGELQFMLLAPGFLAMLVSASLALGHERKRQRAGWAAMAAWKIPLLAIMVLSSLGLHLILSTLAFRRKARVAGILYMVAVLCMLSLAGMASGEQSIARQWIEEGVNSVGQISFAVGSYLLYARYRSGGTKASPQA
jgi:hypothetical protein